MNKTMAPTMKLRWLILENVVTKEMVFAERARTDDPLRVCQQRLRATTTPVLQQWHEGEDGGAWVAVDTVVEVSPAVPPTPGPALGVSAENTK